jgi:monooxygenase
VLIVGAGISGIGAARRLQERCPGKTFAILEARDAIGGTWDLFRFPRIRSDSDMFTLSYPFRPLTEAQAIADGWSIRRYIEETAQAHGVDERIRFHHCVLQSNGRQRSRAGASRWSAATRVRRSSCPAASCSAAPATPATTILSSSSRAPRGRLRRLARPT